MPAHIGFLGAFLFLSVSVIYEVFQVHGIFILINALRIDVEVDSLLIFYTIINVNE